MGNTKTCTRKYRVDRRSRIPIPRLSLSADDPEVPVSTAKLTNSPGSGSVLSSYISESFCGPSVYLGALQCVCVSVKMSLFGATLNHFLSIQFSGIN